MPDFAPVILLVWYSPTCKDSPSSHSPLGICKKTRRRLLRHIEPLHRQGYLNSADWYWVTAGQETLSPSTDIERSTRSPDIAPWCSLGRPRFDRLPSQHPSQGHITWLPSSFFQHLCNDCQLSNHFDAIIPLYNSK